MADDFLNFDSDKLNLDDLNFNISSTIPENELLEFTSGYTNNAGNTNNLNSGDNTNINNNGEHLDIIGSHIQDPLLDPLNEHLNIDNPVHMDPTQLINQSYDSSYLSPIASPYTNPIHISSSFQPQSLQQSISQSLRGRQSSISGSIASTMDRKNSLYDPLESIASPANSTRFNQSSAYFSPSGKSVPLHNPNTIPTNSQFNQITSPDSFNDALSPYSSFDPSSFKSPRSIGASPIPSGSLNGPSSLPKQQLTKEDKIRRRREFHNQVERRRRDLIKEKIKELGLIVPPSLLYIDEEGKEVKASKNVIINKTVDYVAHLHKVMKEQESRRAKLTSKIEELAALTGTEGVSSSSQTPGNSNSATPQPPTEHQNVKINNEQIDDQNFILSAIPPVKLEDQQNFEFDVNEFLKEHNETWDHSST